MARGMNSPVSATTTAKWQRVRGRGSHAIPEHGGIEAVIDSAISYAQQVCQYDESPHRQAVFVHYRLTTNKLLGLKHTAEDALRAQLRFTDESPSPPVTLAAALALYRLRHFDQEIPSTPTAADDELVRTALIELMIGELSTTPDFDKKTMEPAYAWWKQTIGLAASKR